jgi:hypothetical protein
MKIRAIENLTLGRLYLKYCIYESVDIANWRDPEGGTRNKNSAEERSVALSPAANTALMAISLPSPTVCVSGKDFPILASNGEWWGWSQFQRLFLFLFHEEKYVFNTKDDNRFIST